MPVPGHAGHVVVRMSAAPDKKTLERHSDMPTTQTHSSSSTPQALVPLSATERSFGLRDHAALWFSLGVGLLVLQVGAYLVPALGLGDATTAIVVGSIIGSAILAWVAKLGADTGLSSAGLMHLTYGSAFARLPVLANVIQLLGWGTFELVVMRDSAVAMGRHVGIMQSEAWPIVMTLVWGGLIALLLTGSMVVVVRRLVSRIALPLVVVALLWLTWQFGQMAMTKGFGTLWRQAGTGGTSWLSALDLVIAMPISWLPLVADYARHGRSGKTAFTGTWVGYTLANIWCYGLGVLVMVLRPGEEFIPALLVAQGGLIALLLILIDEIDNAYSDSYSGAVSAQSLFPQWRLRTWAYIITGLCTLFALALPIHSLEPFLLMLSSVFVPLFGVILGRLAWQRQLDTDNVSGRPVNVSAVALWVIGLVTYQLLAKFAPQLGAALPTLVITFVLAFVSRPRKSQLR